MAGLIVAGPFEDSSRRLLGGATVSLFTEGTSVLAAVWTDAAGTLPAANPRTLDAYGQLPATYAATETIDAVVNGGRVTLPVNLPTLLVDGSVSTVKLAAGAVTAAKVAADVATQAELDADVAAQAATYLRVKPLVNLTFDGDSQTVSGTFGETYPNQTVRGMDTRATFANVGIGGQTLANLMTTAAARVDSLYQAGGKNICLVWVGTNDLAVSAVTAATLQANLETYCAARRAVGWKVVVFTLLPRSDALSAANYDSKRLTFNTWLAANWTTFADAFCDVAAVPGIGVAGNETNLQFFDSTLVHMSSSGYALVARLARTALANLGVPAIARQITRSLWVPAVLMSASGGGETSMSTLNAYSVWNMPNTGVPLVTASVQVPVDWTTTSVQLFWTNMGAGAGTVIWRMDTTQPDVVSSGVASGLLSFTNGVQTAGITASAQYILAKSNILNANGNVLSLDAGRIVNFRILRTGGTLANAAGILGLLLEKAS